MYTAVREEDVAEIVHDLKNPLSTITLEACLLDYKLAAGEYADLQSAVERIKQNIAFANRIVHDLLDLCSLDVGHFELVRRPIELRELVRQIVERVVPSRDRARVRVETPLSIVAEADDLRIERVIANLVHNALKYAPSPAAIVVRLERDADEACISVRDGGPGMIAEDRDHIFEKFRRGTSAHAHEGCGLGLYLAKKIVEAHGGRIDVDSEPGRGSCFYFVLPLHT